MTVTDRALTVAVRKAIDLRLLPKADSAENVARNWQAIRAVVQAALDADEGTDAEIDRLRSALESTRAEADESLSCLHDVMEWVNAIQDAAGDLDPPPLSPGLYDRAWGLLGMGIRPGGKIGGRGVPGVPELGGAD